MSPVCALSLLVALQVGDAPPAVADPDDLRDAPAAAPAPPPAPAGAGEDDDAAQARDLALLQGIEARLSVGQPLSDDDVARVLAVLQAGAPRARALAAAVLPWLDPPISAPPLLRATRDSDALVRATAAQSLVALARRLPDEHEKAAVEVALALLDDASDEVACAGAELLAALNPPGMHDAFAARAQTAGDVRYACFVRSGGLPIRSVQMPPLPKEEPTPAPPDAALPSTETSPSVVRPKSSTQWLTLAGAAGAGLLAGGALPAALLPSRDVLVYDDTSSRLAREEVSFTTQVGSAVLGAALLGGAAYGAERLWGPLSDTEAVAVLGGAGNGAVLGAGLGLVLGQGGSGQALTLSLGATVGLVGGGAAAWTTDLTENDNALMATSMAMGALATGLGTFAAVPVGLDTIGSAQRTDFGLGAAMAGGGLFGLLSLGAAPFLDVPAHRLAATTAGGLLGGGLATALGFLLVPKDLDVGSRIACGVGLGGQIVGATLAALFVPAVPAGAVDVQAHAARIGFPALVAFSPLPGTAQAPLGAVVQGSF